MGSFSGEEAFLELCGNRGNGSSPFPRDHRADSVAFWPWLPRGHATGNGWHFRESTTSTSPDGTALSRIKWPQSLAFPAQCSSRPTAVNCASQYAIPTSLLFVYGKLASMGRACARCCPESFHQDPGECCGRWNADGSYFFFVALRNGRNDIWAIHEKIGVFHRASPDPQPLTTGPLSYLSFAPALAGNRLFVIGEQQRAQLQHFDSKAKQFVPFFDGISGGEIEFSRDGKWVTYVGYPDYAVMAQPQ